MRHRFRDILLYILASVVIVGGVFGMFDALATPGGAQKSGPGLADKIGIWALNPIANLDRLNILLLGSDDRVLPNGEVDRGRSDSVMVLALNPKLKHAAMLSLPRDLLVTIPEVPKGVQTYPQKLNHAYAFGGVKLSERTIEREFGLHFDHYAKIGLKDFVQVVDMLGGVDMNIPDYEGQGRGMNYDDSWGNLHVHLKPGFQHLNGRQAMGFVRYRKSDNHTKKGGWIGITDSERAGNQQLFLKAMVEQKAKVSNLPALMRAASYIMQHIDTDMDWKTMVGLANVMRGLDTSKILHLTPPVDDKTIGGIYYSAPQPGSIDGLRRRIDAFLAGATEENPQGNMPYLKLGPTGTATPGTPAAAAAKPATPAHPLRVRILNGSGTPGVARTASDLVADKTVRLEPAGNADRYDYAATIIQYAPGQQAAAGRVAARLNLPRAQLQAVSVPPGTTQPDLTIILGRDFSGAAARGPVRAARPIRP
ncbi:MAG TPA: LCP family protein [Armatimonadota bacterium]|jgi:LCP family protein required for cell wall assembly